MKIISNIMFFILVVVMLTASVMLCVLGWIIYPVLWLSRVSHWAWRMVNDIIGIVKQDKTK